MRIKNLKLPSSVALSALLLVNAFLLIGCANNSNETKTTPKSAIESSSLLGAWESTVDIDGNKLKVVQIVADGFFSAAFYTSEPNQFMGTQGGKWSLASDTLITTYEFNTFDTSMVNSSERAVISMKDGQLSVEGSPYTWTKLDDGQPGSLNGAWLMAGRKRDGEISRREEGPRKTMKILSGTRFQWIAYHTETTRFSGSGGGTYTTVDGKYVENIDFFSRDSSRVGAALDFNYELVDGEWHHSGLSSKGDPIYEIWAPRK